MARATRAIPFDELWASYERKLRAERKRDRTIETYSASVSQFVAYCKDQGWATAPEVVDMDTIARLLKSCAGRSFYVCPPVPLGTGKEGDAMQIGGWKTRSMLDRYGASGAA